MSLLHRHRWSETKRYFVPPANRRVRVEHARADEILEGALHGFTVVELRCENCGDIAERRLEGDAT